MIAKISYIEAIENKKFFLALWNTPLSFKVEMALVEYIKCSLTSKQT